MTTPQLLSTYAGHWTGDGTGVTVIVPPPGTVGSGEVRGGAPATREFELLAPTRLVPAVNAVVLSGGSAFGLAAGDGVMRGLRDRGVGFETPLGPVPIVVGMSIFDGSVGAVPPSAADGAKALSAALAGEPFETGAVGAGAGATTGKWRSRLDPGGLGVAYGSVGSASLAAVVVVNAWGDVLSPAGSPVFGGDPAVSGRDPAAFGGGPADFGGGSTSEVVPGPSVRSPFANTTVGVLLTDARLDKSDCFLLAQSGHTGYARAIHPAHSRYDGDAVVALATGAVEADLDLLRATATGTMAAAIRNAVSHV
ncbi:P1 family peptidase [Paractinoplanes rhizophilus]|uniref:P1 family peptidase n=1 Tax=Paractinoplanes rhizophilus TaxID=1416877 RepID=A0ABW2HSU5_9ACTN